MAARLAQLKLDYFLISKEEESQEFSVILKQRNKLPFNSILKYIKEYFKNRKIREMAIIY